MSAPELEIENLTLRYGGLTAIDALSLSVETGSLHALIGPNGAGKTSVFNAISGLARGQSGAIRLRGERIERLSPDARARRETRPHLPEPAAVQRDDRARKRPRRNAC